MDQRHQHRSDVESIRFLTTRLRAENMDEWGNIVDATCTGMAVTMFDAHSELLPEGAPVELEIHVGPNHPFLTVNGHIRTVDEHEGQQRYGIEFDEGAPTDDTNSVILNRIFNRRVAQRISLEGDDQAHVRFFDPSTGAWAHGWLQDISTSGAAVRVPIIDSLALESCERLGIEFCLPGEDTVLKLHAILRDRRPVGADVIVGVEFDRGSTPLFNFKQDALLDFVATRMHVLGDDEAA